jgi:hypothetical protein
VSVLITVPVSTAENVTGFAPAMPSGAVKVTRSVKVWPS